MPRGAKAFRKAVTGGSKDEDEEPETASTPVPAPKPKEAPTPKAQAQDAPVDESDEGSESGSKKETKGQMAQRHKRVCYGMQLPITHESYIFACLLLFAYYPANDKQESKLPFSTSPALLLHS